MNESEFGKYMEPRPDDEDLDLGKEEKYVLSMINAMDAAGYSKLTTRIKRNIDTAYEPSGMIKPHRLRFLRKRVENLFHGHYKHLQETSVEWIRELDQDPAERNFYCVPTRDIGYYGLGHVNFTRSVDGLSWETSEIGSGYTTTASSSPSWLRDYEKGKAIENGECCDGHWESGNHGFRYARLEAKIVGIPVIILDTDRVHENGMCGSYTFEFSNRELADRFSTFLQDKEIKAFTEFTAEDKIRFLFDDFKVDLNDMRDKMRYGLDHKIKRLVNSLHLIDPKYIFMKFDDKSVLNKYGVFPDVNRRDLDEAREAYKRGLKEEFREIISFHLKSESKEPIWPKIEEALTGFEEKIIGNIRASLSNSSDTVV
ncbi:MAG: hypothetical protein ABII72_02075 [Parcubacteria group bacterium]